MKNINQKNLKKYKLKIINFILKTNAFTLLEILIVISIILLLAIAVFILLDPKKQIDKVWDAKRKNELSKLKKVLEDWYNDKNCYPRPNEICYNSVGPNNTCYICGNHRNSPSFSPYLDRIPCDPESPRKNYLYQVDNINCPTWYRIYTDLSTTTYVFDDSSTQELECFAQSCGPPPDYGYDYGISSSNIELERIDLFYYCARTGCNSCGINGSYQECLNLWETRPDLFCNRKRIILPINHCIKKNCPCQPY